MQTTIKTKASFIQRLLPLASMNRDREQSIAELGRLLDDYPRQNINKVIEQLDIFRASQIENIYRSYENRKLLPEYNGFSLGERVRYIGLDYRGLAVKALIIVEFDLPWIVCVLPSGLYSPGIIFEDIDKN